MLQGLGLSRIILLSIVFTVLMVAGAGFVVSYSFQEVEFAEGLVRKAETILGRMQYVSDFVANQGGLKEVIEKYQRKYRSSDELTEEDKKMILKQVPIYGAMFVANEAAEKDLYRFRVFSREPRNPDNKATVEEEKILEKFKNEPELKQWVVNSDQQVIVYRPVRISEKKGCLTCHGDPQQSPWGNKKDILGYPMENYKDGHLHAAFAVIQDKQVVKAANSSHSILYSLGAMILASLIVLVLIYFLIKPRLNRMEQVYQNIHGEMVQLETLKAEILKASAALSESTQKEASMTQEMASASTEVESMIAKTVTSVEQSRSILQESVKQSESVQQSMADLLEKNTALVEETKNLVDLLKAGGQQMHTILQVMKDIENNTQAIHDVAFQTKILSFNASVEAARAGEHGKGFAVVAQEIGELSQLSGQSAETIKKMITSSMEQVKNIVSDWQQKSQEGQEALNLQIQESSYRLQTSLEQVQQFLNEMQALYQEIQNISLAAQEQEVGIKEISKTTQHVNLVTRSNATQAEELKKVAAKLTTSLEQLEAQERVFQELVAGRDRS